jgi:GLPGLI family protein
MIRHLLATGAATFLAAVCMAQTKAGFVQYEMVIQLQGQIQIQGLPAGVELPKSRTSHFELSFGNNQSLWKTAEEAPEPEMAGGGGVQLRTFSFGGGDIVFADFNTKMKTEKKELLDKSFIVEDSIRNNLNWKMTGETKTILGYTAMKATTSRVSKSFKTSMVDGQITRTESVDTLPVVAWFTTAIPVAAGPSSYEGQLPGLILELDFGNGRNVYKAISVSDKVKLDSIKAPKGKKKHTPAEFEAERKKVMDEMQKNGGGMRFRAAG